MDTKAQKALQLLNQGKIKKALQLSNKINKQPSKQSFLSLEVEGVCLYNLERYQMAEIVLAKAFSKAQSIGEKLNTLKNLVSVSFANGKMDAVCQYLEDSVELDSSVENIDSRFKLCEVSFRLEKFQVVTKYAPKLINSSEHFVTALLLLIKSHNKLGNLEANIKYCEKAIAELSSFSVEQASELASHLYEKKNAKLLHLFLEKGENKFGLEMWFTNIKAELSSLHSIEVTEDAIENSGVTVIGENQVVVELINNFIDTLANNGAIFHPKLRVIESSGNLSIKSYSSAIKAEKLMSIPLNCMPLLSDFEVEIVDNDLLVHFKADMLNPDSKVMIKLLFNIYNATNKIKNWKETYPLLALKNATDIAYTLLATNPSNTKMKTYKSLMESERWDELALKSFIGSREVTYDQSSLKASGINTTRNFESGLLSIIDFINHKANSSFYQQTRGSDRLEVIATPDKETREVFVQYNISDPVISYLIYGFIDEQAPWLYSIPNTIETNSGLSIIIQNQPNVTNKSKSSSHNAIDSYMPSNIELEGNKIKVNSIIIPEKEAHGSLSEVLRHILKTVNARGIFTSSQELHEEVSNLEKQLLNNNLIFWDNFRSKIRQNSSCMSQTTEIELIRLYTICSGHIRDYMNKSGIALF